MMMMANLASDIDHATMPLLLVMMTVVMIVRVRMNFMKDE